MILETYVERFMRGFQSGASAIAIVFDDILPAMKSIITPIFLLLSSLWAVLPAAAAEQSVMQFGAEFWFEPRHGEQLLAQPPLKAAVQQLWLEPEAYLVINYPATESGELWGRELQAWLVSLGIVSDRIELRSGYTGEGVELVLVTPDGAEPHNEAIIESIVSPVNGEGEAKKGEATSGAETKSSAEEQPAAGEESAATAAGAAAADKNKNSEVEPQ